MIAKLEFHFDDFDDRQAHLRCIKANDMANLIREFANNSYRTYIKHNKVSEEYGEGFKKALEYFNYLLDEAGINVNTI